MSDIERAIKVLEHQNAIVAADYLDDDGIYTGEKKGSKEDINFLEVNDLAISALEKQIAKKSKKIKLRQGTQWLCPACGDTVAGLRADLLYCNECGQKLDWSVEE